MLARLIQLAADDQATCSTFWQCALWPTSIRATLAKDRDRADGVRGAQRAKRHVSLKGRREIQPFDQLCKLIFV